MKPLFTPLEEFEEFLTKYGQTKIKTLIKFIPDFQKKFKMLESLSLDITPDAAVKFMDFDDLQPKFYKELLQSGLLIEFDWQDWEEGGEILEGLREFQSTNPIKIFKIFTLIVRKDQKENGYFERMLKNRTILSYLMKLESLMPLHHSH